MSTQFADAQTRDTAARTLSWALRLDGSMTAVDLGEGQDTGAVLRSTIDAGLIDRVALAPGLDMWLDDEGLYTAEPNAYATALAATYGLNHQLYHGVVVLAGVDEQGRTGNLTNEQRISVIMRLGLI